MAFAQSFYNQSSVLSINIMLVDDDPTFLRIMSRMLAKSTYGDPSLMEITVIAAKNSMEALSTLKVQRNIVDLIVTDYYMPGMNGLQLKSEITREYGNLPVIVISSDANKEQESLSCGALCFIPKPIKKVDLTMIHQLALTYKRNGKSIAWNGHNHNDIDHVTVPMQIQLLPDQVNVLTNNKKPNNGGDSGVNAGSKSVNSTHGSSFWMDGSRKPQHQKRKPNGVGSGDKVESLPQTSKKRKIKWTDFLHERFLQAIQHIGLDKAVPKKILEYMNVPNLTRENVASHLQKYRIFLRKVAEKGSIHSSTLSEKDIDLIYPNSQITEMYYNYFKNSKSWYDTTLMDRSFYMRSRHGFGQSSLLSINHEPFLSNQITPYNYMNRSSTYQPRYIGSKMTLPIESNLNLTNQPSQNEGRRSFIQQPVMENMTSQTSQVLGFGQHGISTTNGNNFNASMISSYGSSTIDQTGLDNNHGSVTFNQQGWSNYGSSTLNQQGLGCYGSLTPNQLGVKNYGNLASNQVGVNNYGSLTPKQPVLTSYGSSPPTQSRLNNYGSSTLNLTGLDNIHGSVTFTQQGWNNNGSSTLNQQGLGIYESLTPNQLGVNNYGSLTSNQVGVNNYGSLAALTSYGSSHQTQSGLNNNGSSMLNQLELSNYGSSTLNQLELSGYDESLTPYLLGIISNEENLSTNQQGPNHVSYGMQSSFLNNENDAYEPPAHANATTQSSFEILQSEDLNIYGDLGNINELPLNIDNFQFDQNKQQGALASNTEFEVPANFSTELNQIFSSENDGDWTFIDINQDGETSNTLAAPETNPTTFNMNPNHNQVQDVPYSTDDWSFLDQLDLVDDDFMNSLFNNDMN